MFADAGGTQSGETFRMSTEVGDELIRVAGAVNFVVFHGRK